jgi:hypothetical protein
MTTKININQEITLVPHELPKTNSDLLNLLKTKLQTKLINTSVKQNYICLDIQEVNILDSSIEHSSGNVVFSLLVNVNALKLFYGQIIEASIVNFDKVSLYCMGYIFYNLGLLIILSGK